jgi:hypothetical protein
MKGTYLPLYVLEKRRRRHIPLYEWILTKAKQMGVRGGELLSRVVYRILATCRSGGDPPLFRLIVRRRDSVLKYGSVDQFTDALQCPDPEPGFFGLLHQLEGQA